MEEFIAGLPEKIKMFAEILGVIAIIATVIARVTPDPKDEGKVKKIVDVVMKVIGYLPTVGINPRTQKLEDAVKGLQKK